jgi:hypothetical protein
MLDRPFRIQYSAVIRLVKKEPGKAAGAAARFCAANRPSGSYLKLEMDTD